MSAKVEIQHLPEVIAAMQRRAAAIQPALRGASRTARQLLVAELTRYPAPPAGSRYVRTEKLKRGWLRSTPLDMGKSFQLINPIAYARFVQGDAQARVHRGRWETVASITQRLREDVLDAYESAVSEAIQ